LNICVRILIEPQNGGWFKLHRILAELLSEKPLGFGFKKSVISSHNCDTSGCIVIAFDIYNQLIFHENCCAEFFAVSSINTYDWSCYSSPMNRQHSMKSKKQECKWAQKK